MKSGKKKTILCIDDESLGLSIRKLMLESEGYRVLTAEDGLQGLAIFQREAVDLVLLDYRMPGMDGDTVASEVKRIQPFVPVMILTAYPDLSERAATLCNQILYKGGDPIVLLTMIQQLLDSTSRALPDPTVCERMIDDAVRIMRSDFASIQMLFPKRGNGELRLLAFRGFNPEAAKFWEWVRADSKSTCGLALTTAERVVAPDIVTCGFMSGSDDQQTYLETGIRACQTTPLIAPAGHVVGMISTHWRMPYEPSERDFRQFDNLARHAANLIKDLPGDLSL